MASNGTVLEFCGSSASACHSGWPTRQPRILLSMGRAERRSQASAEPRSGVPPEHAAVRARSEPDSARTQHDGANCSPPSTCCGPLSRNTSLWIQRGAYGPIGEGSGKLRRLRGGLTTARHSQQVSRALYKHRRRRNPWWRAKGYVCLATEHGTILRATYLLRTTVGRYVGNHVGNHVEVVPYGRGWRDSTVVRQAGELL